MIRIENLSKTFRRHRVLDAVNLGLADGDRVALIGANGAGKTTLIRCLLGEYVCEGSIEIRGLAPRAARTEVLRRVGFVPQVPPPLGLAVGQLLHYAASLCGADPSRMEEIARRLGLDPREKWRQPFVKLSGGQKQKLLIAVALGRETDVLILDEPAANLDPQGRRMFFELLAERDASGVMLLSSHRLDEVASLVNRVVELDQGRVVLDDRVADPARLDTLLDCHLRLSRREPAAALALESWHLRDGGDGLSWQGTIAGADRLRFLGLLSRYSGLIEGLSLEERSMSERRNP
jgi:ABC-2 type transport system ATP-binding protein